MITDFDFESELIKACYEGHMEPRPKPPKRLERMKFTWKFVGQGRSFKIYIYRQFQHEIQKRYHLLSGEKFSKKRYNPIKRIIEIYECDPEKLENFQWNMLRSHPLWVYLRNWLNPQDVIKLLKEMRFVQKSVDKEFEERKEYRKRTGNPARIRKDSAVNVEYTTFMDYTAGKVDLNAVPDHIRLVETIFCPHFQLFSTGTALPNQIAVKGPSLAGVGSRKFDR